VADEVLLLYVEKSAHDELHHMVQVYLESVAGKIRQEMVHYGRDVKLETAITFGDPAEKILETANDSGVDLIIISTHGTSGFKRWVLGSVCDRVVRGGDFPTMVVRAGDGRSNVGEQYPPKTLLVTLDGSPESETALRMAGLLASEFNLTVFALRVVPVADYQDIEERDKIRHMEILRPGQKSAEEYLHSVISDLKADGITAHPVVAYGLPEEEIIAFAEKNDVDMMAMSTHGRSGVSRWAMGSVADKVLQEVRIPFLLVRSRTN